jgi:hypothetical protein
MSVSHTPWEKKFFERKTTSIKHWQNGQYLEFNNFDDLKRLFVETFVNGKRRLDLFNSLGMTYKPNDGRPQGSKNKPKAKFKVPQPIDLNELLAKEMGEYSRELREQKVKSK